MTNRKHIRPKSTEGKWLVMALIAFCAIVLLVPGQLPADIETQVPSQKLAEIPSGASAEILEASVGPAPSEPGKDPGLTSSFSNEEPTRIIKGKIAKNYTFSKILIEAGMQVKTVDAIVRATRPVFNLNRLKSGASYKVALASDNSIIFFDYKISDDRYLRVARQGDLFKPELRNIEYRIETELILGTIQNNLITAMQKAGGNFQIAMKLTEVFSWDIDFFKDIRRGDEFKIMVEKKYHNGQFVKFGKILAAIFVNKGKAFDAVYFANSDSEGGYYTTEGEPLRKQFLKTPLKFSRISSTYGHRRFHPIYKTYMPHLRVDYAAPIGTPVHAVSDGVIDAAGNSARSGNYLALRHNHVYRTTYSHLSRFAKGIASGTPVRQGQVIGYVGATGSATGPHLCFQLQRHGKSVNPLTFKSPGGPPISKEFRAAFFQTSSTSMLALKGDGPAGI